MRIDNYVAWSSSSRETIRPNEAGRLWTDGVNCCSVVAAAFGTGTEKSLYLQHYLPTQRAMATEALESNLVALRAHQADYGTVVVALPEPSQQRVRQSAETFRSLARSARTVLSEQVNIIPVYYPMAAGFECEMNLTTDCSGSDLSMAATLAKKAYNYPYGDPAPELLRTTLQRIKL